MNIKHILIGTVLTVSLTACAGGTAYKAGTEAEKPAETSKAEPAEPVVEEPTAEPEPVDPDVEYATTMANDPQFMSHMKTVMGQLGDFTDATGSSDFAGAASAGHAAADTYDWLADRIDSKPVSSDSSAAQEAMAAFRQCRDAYDSAATAISDLDVTAMNIAVGDINACTRAVEGATSQM